MDRVAIITAASKGMGRACAHKLAEKGYKVVVFSRSSEIHQLATKLNGLGVQGLTNKFDDLDQLVKKTLQTYGRIDVVVNNTGHPPKGDLLELTDEQWAEGMDLALMNVVRMAKLVTGHMKEGGSIINISTFGAKQPSLNFPISSVARAALSSYAKLYATRYGSDKIRMNNVLPGFIDSYPASQEVIDQIPLLRQGTPEEVAELVYFLASDKSGYITGQDFLIDGGLVKST